LNRCAERLNIPSIDSVTFYQLMRQALSTTQQKTHTSDEVVKLHDDALNIDTLMMEASKIVPQKSEDFAAEQPKRHHTKKHETTKQERALLKKLKKL